MEQVIDRAYRLFRYFLDYGIAYGAAIIMLAGTSLAVIEIFRRYMFGVVYDWGQDAVTYFIVSSVFLFFAVTQARRSHLAVTIAVDLLRNNGFAKLALTIRAFITLFGLGLYSCFAWWGLPAVERSMMMGRTTLSMVLYTWPFQAALIAGFTLMALTCLFQLYQDIQAVRGKQVFPWAPIEEGIDI